MSDSVQALQADFEAVTAQFAKLEAALKASKAERTNKVSRSLRSALKKLDQLAFHHRQFLFDDVNFAFAQAREAAKATLNEFMALSLPIVELRDGGLKALQEHTSTGQADTQLQLHTTEAEISGATNTMKGQQVQFGASHESLNRLREQLGSANSPARAKETEMNINLVNADIGKQRIALAASQNTIKELEKRKASIQSTVQTYDVLKTKLDTFSNQVNTAISANEQQQITVTELKDQVTLAASRMDQLNSQRTEGEVGKEDFVLSILEICDFSLVDWATGQEIKTIVHQAVKDYEDVMSPFLMDMAENIRAKATFKV